MRLFDFLKKRPNVIMINIDGGAREDALKKVKFEPGTITCGSCCSGFVNALDTYIEDAAKNLQSAIRSRENQLERKLEEVLA